MFDKYANRGRHVAIIDFNHVLHRFHIAMGRLGLSSGVNIDGRIVEVETGTVKGVLEFIVKVSDSGRCPLILVSDLPVKSRKEYFSQMINSGNITSTDGGYKESRSGMRESLRNSSILLLDLLQNSGIMLLKQENYEADDIIPVAIDLAKKNYPDLPIHIIANDLDLAPLVDEQVSLYKYPSKITYAEQGYLELNKYCQVTPRNYQEVMEGTSLFKKLSVPYNSVLLAKLIRGDKSDNISQLKGWTPTKYNTLIQNLIDDGVDMSIFRYYPWETKYKDIETGEIYDERPVGKQVKLYPVEPKGIEVIIGVLAKYVASSNATAKEIKDNALFTEDELVEIINRYHGMNLNGYFLNTPTKRKPLKLKDDVKFGCLNLNELLKLAQVYKINVRH